MNRLCYRRLTALAARLRASRDGAVLPIFAVVMILSILIVGGATDYVFVQQARTKLDAAADAAVLSATGKTAMTLTAADAQTLAGTAFLAQLPANVVAYVKTKTPTVTDVGTARSAALTYTAIVPTTFLKMIGIPSFTLNGSSSAASSLPTYIDFYLLLDNTPSMGVAATTDGINLMEANTPDHCAFACHETSASSDNYRIAQKLNVQTRISVVRTATQKLMDTATSTQTIANQFRMAVYTFGASATTRKLTTIKSLTNDLTAVKTAAGAIDLMSVPDATYNSEMTDFDGIFTSMNSKIPNPGPGDSASATPQKILFFVSDGVADTVYTSACSETQLYYMRCQEPLTVSNCTTIKNRGIKIAVLYTTYLPLPTNDWYKSTVAPWASKIATNMKACASPGLYFEVSPSDGITEAMSALFAKAVKSAYLTK